MTLKICSICNEPFESKSKKPYKICKNCCITKVENGNVKNALEKHKKVIENLSLKTTN
jgi:hypothetical protein